MSRTALNTISDIEHLRAAWKDLYSRASSSSRFTTGYDHQSLHSVLPHLDAELEKLSTELRREVFAFRPLRAVVVPKGNGKDRVICVPTVRDRIVQRSLLLYLKQDNRLRILNTASYGFIPDLPWPVKAASEHACGLRKSHPWVYKTDISAFFDNIQRASLITKINVSVRAITIRRLLRDAVGCEIAGASGAKQKKIKALGIIEGQGLRQGMPLSPLLANFVLREFDQAMIRKGLHMVRYADDLIFMADSEEDCHAIHSLCKTELAKLELKVPDLGPNSKTKIYPPPEPAEFLGVELAKRGSDYILQVGKAVFDDIKAEILSYSDLAKLNREGIDIRRFGAKLTAIKGGYSPAYDYCANGDMLMNSIDGWTRQAAQELFRKGFGVDLGKLTTEQAQFLGLHS